MQPSFYCQNVGHTQHVMCFNTKHDLSLEESAVILVRLIKHQSHDPCRDLIYHGAFIALSLLWYNTVLIPSMHENATKKRLFPLFLYLCERREHQKFWTLRKCIRNSPRRAVFLAINFVASFPACFSCVCRRRNILGEMLSTLAQSWMVFVQRPGGWCKGCRRYGTRTVVLHLLHCSLGRILDDGNLVVLLRTLHITSFWPAWLLETRQKFVSS